jgi:hypothetical protein
MRRAGIGIGDRCRVQLRGLTIKPMKGAGEESKTAVEVDAGELVVAKGRVLEIFKFCGFHFYVLIVVCN